MNQASEAVCFFDTCTGTSALNGPRLTYSHLTQSGFSLVLYVHIQFHLACAKNLTASSSLFLTLSVLDFFAKIFSPCSSLCPLRVFFPTFSLFIYFFYCQQSFSALLSTKGEYFQFLIWIWLNVFEYVIIVSGFKEQLITKAYDCEAGWPSHSQPLPAQTPPLPTFLCSQFSITGRAKMAEWVDALYRVLHRKFVNNGKTSTLCC